MVFPSAYIAANRQGLGERFFRLGQVALTAPLTPALSMADRAFSMRLLFMAFQGMSEDRITVLGEELVQEILKSRISTNAFELLGRAKAEGHTIVLVSESIAQIAGPLLGRIGNIDHLICNHLVFRNRIATGKLQKPVIGGTGTARALREFAREHGIDLSTSVAYGSSRSDQILLETVGKPVAVNPDPFLRWTARQSEWPVLSLPRP